MHSLLWTTDADRELEKHVLSSGKMGRLKENIYSKARVMKMGIFFQTVYIYDNSTCNHGWFAEILSFTSLNQYFNDRIYLKSYSS